MLTLKYTNGKTAEWRKGQPFPVMEEYYRGGPKPVPVEILHADDEELTYIDERFTNIPMAITDRGVKWRGEMAQFIVDNLLDLV